jgi:hypothetical protein
MADVRRLEEMNLHDQQWFFSNEESGLAEILTGASPFGDGELEALDGLPEGISIPESPEAPQDSRALDKTLKEKIHGKGLIAWFTIQSFRTANMIELEENKSQYDFS